MTKARGTMTNMASELIKLITCQYLSIYISSSVTILPTVHKTGMRTEADGCLVTEVQNNLSCLMNLIER